jgi:hypothetical protein
VLQKLITQAKSQMVVAAMATLGALVASVVPLYQQYFGTYSVVIASSPSDAQIRVNGKDMGKTPTTLELKRGTYTVEASRTAYEPAQRAFYVSPHEPNLVNIQLVPQPVQPKSSPNVTAANVAGGTTNVAVLVAEVAKLKAAVITNPEEALSLPLIREKLRVQEELAKALRDDLKEVKEQTKWYLGSMIAIVVGLLTVIATLFIGLRSK